MSNINTPARTAPALAMHVRHDTPEGEPSGKVKAGSVAADTEVASESAETIEIQSIRITGRAYITVERNGRIHLSAEVVRQLQLEAGLGITFVCDKSHANFYLKPFLGRTLLRAMPSRRMLVCNNLAFANIMFEYLDKAKADGMPIESNTLESGLFRCLVATRCGENGLHQIMIDKTI